MADDFIQRQMKRDRTRRKYMIINRFMSFLFVMGICALIIIYCTPVFNIRSIKVVGNEQISTEEITARCDVADNQNLFKINTAQLAEAVKSIPYVENVTVKKVYIPAGIKVIVEESKAEAYIKCGDDKKLLIDRNCKILSETTENVTGIPEITGVDLQDYSIGNKLNIDESDKSDIILICITSLDEQGILQEVNKINIDDNSSWFFEYQNRITVEIDSMTDVEHKIAIFKGALKTSQLSDNARGTITFDSSLQAIYTP